MEAAFLFAAACNLDTILLSAAYSLRGARFSLGAKLILAAVTTVVTAVSLLLGRLSRGLFAAGTGSLLGGVALMGMGLWTILDFIRKPQQMEEEPKAGTTYWEILQLAAALAVNNAGVGAAAGAAELSLWWACGANFIVTLCFLPLGRVLAKGSLGRKLEPWAIPLSGLLLILLGAGLL